MFTKSVTWYDALYSWKDYKRGAQRLKLLMDKHAQRPIDTLLDVACGTGEHLTYLKDNYAVERLDLDPKMLNLARQRHPSVARVSPRLLFTRAKRHERREPTCHRRY